MKKTLKPSLMSTAYMKKRNERGLSIVFNDQVNEINNTKLGLLHSITHSRIRLLHYRGRGC